MIGMCCSHRQKLKKRKSKAFISLQITSSFSVSQMGENEQKTGVAVQTLMNLGLTSCQARIYIALVLNGRCSADLLSKISRVTRQDIYRILPKLQEIGLTRKIVDVPVEWEAIPLKGGLALLMDAQNRRYLGLQTQITQLLDNFIVPNTKRMDLDSTPDFIIIPKGQQQIKWWIEKIENLQSSWDGFTDSKDLGKVSTYLKNILKEPLIEA